jgi:transmembrane 9 superfamily protein 2/4
VKLEKGKQITFTYSVKFVENNTLQWATRWDIYFEQGMAEKDEQIHLFAIINSFAMVMFLTGMVAHILRRTVNKAITYYNERADLEVEETGWKQVHGDVFRPPSYPGIFSIIIGSGVQVAGMSFLTLVFACLGFLAPNHRGGLLTTMLLLFVFMGSWAGYTSARIYKFFGGEQWKRNTVGTAILFPGMVFGVYFVVNATYYFEESSAALSFPFFFLIILLWFGISAPLVFLGSAIGFRKPVISKPTKVNRIPKPLMTQPDEQKMKIICLMAGSLPFGCMFIELSYIMKYVWTLNYFYYLFVFVMLCFIVLVITSAEVSILMCYILLCKEDYRWWWLSVGVAGSSGLYLFLYSIIYWCVEAGVSNFGTFVLYFGVMSIASAAFCLVTGTIGFLASFLFVRKIYGLIKID